MIGSPAQMQLRDHRPLTSVSSGQLLFLGALLVFCYAFVVNGWVVDDAYITFRTVRNILQGHGPVWNLDERVQAYTHPLWLIVLLPTVAICGEYFYSSQALSLLLCIAAFIATHRRAAKLNESWRSALLVVLVLTSKTIVDYSSSGLENPLSFLLIALFYSRLRIAENPSAEALDPRPALLLASLAFVTRMDTVLLYLPIVVAITSARLRREPARTLATILTWSSPAIAWLLFATLYYGSPIPNTAYAKAAAGVPFGDRLRRGLTYAHIDLVWDPTTHLAVLGAGALAWVGRQRLVLLALGGIVFYELYVVGVAAAATHMAGRFFALPLFAGLLLLVSLLPRRSAAWAAAVSLVFTLASAVAPLKAGTRWYRTPRESSGYSDARAIVQKRDMSLSEWLWKRQSPDNPRFEEGRRFAGSPFRVHVGGAWGRESIGYFAFAARPDQHVVDYLGLTDPLLARLPACNAVRPEFWAAGHFYRHVPDGYLQSVRDGNNQLRNQRLRAYYDVVRLLTRAPVFDGQRLTAIIGMATGRYEYLLEEYRNAELDPSQGDCRRSIALGGGAFR